ncbi:MAG: GNAT family N-acetyltransferase [archaeon]|nr:GNAT family N-acetyltransferase [archaeon]
MKIQKISLSKRKHLAKFLVSYWKSRGMNYSFSWAMQYLKKGMVMEFSEERFIAVDENENILGTIALLKNNYYVAEIRDEVWQNDLIGSLLLQELVMFAKKNKIKKLFSLALKNKISFYKKYGFKKEGMLKDQFKKGEHVAIMSKFI